MKFSNFLLITLLVIGFDITYAIECGSNGLSCKSGYCCSKYGYCGTSEKYCGSGCQPRYGKCDLSVRVSNTKKTTTTTKRTTTTTKKTTTKSSTSTSTRKINEDGRCGPEFDNAVCPEGECCSKYGYCGVSLDHCSAEDGCQKGFGSCYESYSTISKDGRCGPQNGYTYCPQPQCCSRTGYCGTTEDYCSFSKGCQNQFGFCSFNVSTNGRCGYMYGDSYCPDDQCCSQYGYCGTSDAHCGTGCQDGYGLCNEEDFDTEEYYYDDY